MTSSAGPFTDPFSFLGSVVEVEMDRPLGTRHPTHGHVYPVNYGYVPGTSAPDGGALDAYVLLVDVPLSTFRGRCVAVIRREDDDDDKLVVVPDGECPGLAEIESATAFQERYFRSRVHFERPPG